MASQHHPDRSTVAITAPPSSPGILQVFLGTQRSPVGSATVADSVKNLITKFNFSIAESLSREDVAASSLSIHYAPRPAQVSWYESWGKRAVDIAIASAALIVCAPIILLAALLISIDSPGPTFYKQKRIGLRGQQFVILKLRTMVIGADRQGCVTQQNDPRVTQIGRLLRKTKIDELPQLVNVLLGDMSIVGARPLSVDECACIEEEGFDWTVPGFYPNLRPGLIGLEQAHRFRALNYGERFRFNAQYENNCSILMDADIFLRCLGQCRYVMYCTTVALLLEASAIMLRL